MEKPNPKQFIQNWVVSKDGQTFIELEPEYDEEFNADLGLQQAMAKGYKPYIDVTKNGEVYTIEANDKEMREAFAKGYMVTGSPALSVGEHKEKSHVSPESVYEGAFDAASYGYRDELAGRVEQAGRKMLGKKGLGTKAITEWGNLEDVGSEDDDGYEEARDYKRGMSAHAFSENPASYLGGSLLGGFATSGPGAAVAKSIGGAKGVIGVAGLEGAIAGAGTSEEEDALGIAKDAGVGAGIGAAIPGAVEGAKFLKNKFVNSLLRVDPEVQDFYRSNRSAVKSQLAGEGVSSDFPDELAGLQETNRQAVRDAGWELNQARNEFSDARRELSDFRNRRDLPEEAVDEFIDYRDSVRKEVSEGSGKAFDVLEAKGRGIDTAPIVSKIDEQLQRLSLDGEGPLIADEAYNNLLKVRNRIQGLRPDPARLARGIKTEFLGYTVEARKIPGQAVNIRVIDPNAPKGQQGVIAFADFVDDVEKGALYPMISSVSLPHQRKGIATYMYNLAEDLTGVKVVPAAPGAQSEQAAKFWQARQQAPRGIGAVASPDQVKRMIMQYDQGVAGPAFDKLRRGESLSPAERVAVGMRGEIDAPLKEIPEYAQQMAEVAPRAEVRGQLDKFGGRDMVARKLRELFAPENRERLTLLARERPEILRKLMEEGFDKQHDLKTAVGFDKALKRRPEARALAEAKARLEATKSRAQQSAMAGSPEKAVPGYLPIDSSKEQKLRLLGGDELVEKARAYAAAKHLKQDRTRGASNPLAMGGLGTAIAGVTKGLDPIALPIGAAAGGIFGQMVNKYGGDIYMLLSDIKSLPVLRSIGGFLDKVAQQSPKALPIAFDRFYRQSEAFRDYVDQKTQEEEMQQVKGR